VDDRDLVHLRRCIELAEEARAGGDHPFGSLLVDGSGRVRAERRNRVVSDRDLTAHPELMLAQWASMHLGDAERAATTMYTSCEHCAMCATAFYWVGLGRLVFAFSGAQLRALAPESAPKLTLDAREVFSRGNRLGIVIEGPATALEAEARAVFSDFFA
jgi:tRNA(Arg) A34 adenosine deaminase TadA